MGVHILEAFFRRHSSESCTANSHIPFISEQCKNPFIYAATNCVFREEFCKLLCWWRVRKIASEVDSNQKGAEREKIEQDETAV